MKRSFGWKHYKAGARPHRRGSYRRWS